MVAVLIMGFQYAGAKELSSVAIDLCRFYYYYFDLGYQVTLVSDIGRITHEDVAGWIRCSNFDPRIFDLFCSDNTNSIQVSSIEEIRDHIEALDHHGWSLIYFSGHGLLSDRGLLDTPYGTLEVDALLAAKDNQDRCVILDCCHCPVVDLPYQHLQKPVYVKKCRSRTANIIVFASSRPGEKSLMSDEGSVMTSNLLKLFKNGMTPLSLYTATEKIDDEIEVRWNLYMSRPERTLWGWIVGRETYGPLLEEPWQIIRTEKNVN